MHISLCDLTSVNLVIKVPLFVNSALFCLFNERVLGYKRNKGVLGGLWGGIDIEYITLLKEKVLIKKK